MTMSSASSASLPATTDRIVTPTVRDASTSETTWLLPVLIILLVFFVLLSLAALTFIAVSAFRAKCSKIRCHLCRSLVPSASWSDGSHRELCAQRNRTFLASLPAPFDIRCPRCLAYLKLLPKDRGSFRCDDKSCPYDGSIRNNGLNRLSCFACDYDLCDSCVHRRIFVLTKLTTRGTVTTDDCSLCQLEVSLQPSINPATFSEPLEPEIYNVSRLIADVSDVSSYCPDPATSTYV